MPDPTELTREQRIAEGEELEAERLAADRIAVRLLVEQAALLEGSESELAATLPAAELERVLAYRSGLCEVELAVSGIKSQPSFLFLDESHGFLIARALEEALVDPALLISPRLGVGGVVSIRSNEKRPQSVNLIELDVDKWRLMHGGPPPVTGHHSAAILTLDTPLRSSDSIPILLTASRGATRCLLRILPLGDHDESQTLDQEIVVGSAPSSVSLLLPRRSGAYCLLIIGYDMGEFQDATGLIGQSVPSAVWAVLCSLE